MNLKLTEVIEKILAGGMTQQTLAAELGTTQGKISEILQGRSTWEKHWQVFLKLLPFCVRLDIIGERELLPGGNIHHGNQNTTRHSKTGKTKANSR